MSSQNFWDDSQIEELAKALTFAYKTQDTYGEPLDLQDRIAGWRFVLEDKFSVDDCLRALRQHMENKNTMPVPAHIKNILEPEQPQVTYGEYIHAKDQWAKELYSPYSYYAQVIKDYEGRGNENMGGNVEIENKQTESGHKIDMPENDGPRKQDDSDAGEKVRIIKQGVKMGKSPDEALKEAGYEV